MEFTAGHVIIAIIGLFGAQLASTGVLYWRLGKLEQSAKCPWGRCPLHDKASDELRGR